MEPLDIDLCEIFTQLAEVVDLQRVMLVGARCRDIHQRKFRKSPASRSTYDVDLAIAVSDWETFFNLRNRFPSPVDAWQKVRIADAEVDLVPFGEIEDPPGRVFPTDLYEMNVAGFDEVFQSSQPHQLHNGLCILVPSVAGFAALKLHAWLDRFPSGTYKDAADIALVLAWFEDRADLWDAYLELTDDEVIGETELMAAAILGADIGRVLGPAATRTLVNRLQSINDQELQLFARKLVADGEHAHPMDRRILQIQQLINTASRFV